MSRIGERRFLVVKTAPEWQALWREHKGPAAPVPAADFDREMVIAAFAGTRPSGGYGLELVKIEDDAELRVFYVETAPRPDAMVAAVLTQPYHIARSARSERPVVFVQLTQR